MVKKSRRWGGPRPAPYNPNARDADHDGMVQEGTIWERPGGSKFVDRLGKEITAAAARTSPGSYIADSNGNRIDYTPSWQRGGAPGAPGEGDLSAIGGRPSLGDLGYPSIGDTGGTIRDTNGTVEGLPDLTPDPRDVEQVGPDGVSLPDGETATPKTSSLSGPEVEAARQRLAKEITTGALQGSNWERSDGRGPGDGLGPEFAVEPIARFELDDKTEREIEALGGTTFPVYEVASDLEGATEFQNAIQYAHDTHKFGTSVDVYPLKDYQGDGIRLFLSPDKKVGYAVKSDGQLVSVFSADDTTQMPLHTIVPLALSQGATRADAFDTVLPDFYSHFGLQPTARIPFDDDYKPDGWNYSLYDKYNNGKPDVVFMRFDPDRIGVSYVPGDGDFVDDYDAGLASTEAVPDIPMDEKSVLAREVQAERLDVMREGGLPMTRGMHMSLDDETLAEIQRLLAPPEEVEDYNQHLKIGPLLLDRMKERGMGTHWTANPRMAETAAGVDQTGSGNTEVIFAALPPDPSLLSDSPDPTGVLSNSEQELSFDDNTVFDMHSILIRDGQNWREVLNPDLPFTGTPSGGHDYSKVDAVKTYRDVPEPIPEVPEIDAIPGIDRAEIVARIEAEIRKHEDITIRGIDVYPEEVADKEGVYDAVNSLVEGQPDPEAGWVFTGSKEVIDGHGDAAEEAVTSYVRNSIPINTDLRDGDISPANQETIDMFDELFEALPESEGGTVYRGAAMRTLLGDVDVESEEELDELIEATIGTVITDDGILSTSTRPEVAVDFSHANRVDGEPEGYLVLELDIPEGGKALGISNYPGRGESEVLLPRGGEYEVISVQKIRKADGDHPTYVVKVAQKQRSETQAEDAVTEPPVKKAVEVDADVIEFLQQHEPGKAEVLQVDTDRVMGELGEVEFRDPYIPFEDNLVNAKFALDEYVNGTWGEEVNGDLRKTPEERISPETGKDLFDEVDGPRVAAVDSLLEATSAPEAYSTYRGVSGRMFFDEVGGRPQPKTQDEVREKLESMIGETISEPGYMSTSIDPEVATGFAEFTKNPVIFRIDVPEGGKGLFLSDTIKRDIHSEDEREVLLPRDSKLKITGVSVLPGETDGKPNIVVDVEQVQHETAAAVTGSIEEALTPADVPSVDTFEAAPELREAVDLYLPNEAEINDMFDVGKMPEIDGQGEAELADKLPKMIEATTGELPEDTPIYRSGNSEEFDFDLGEDPQDLIGQEIASDGFMAGRTSEYEPPDVDGAGYTYSLKIEASEGDLGAHVGEDRVVLPPGTRIEVTDVELVEVDGVERLQVTGKPITEKVDVEDAVSVIGGEVPTEIVDNMVEAIWKDTPKPKRKKPPNEVREVQLEDGGVGKVEILTGLVESLRKDMLVEKDRTPLQANAAKALEAAEKVTDYRNEEHGLEGAADVVYDYTSGHMGSTVNGALRSGGLDPDGAAKVRVLDEVIAGTSAEVPYTTTRGMPIEGLLGPDAVNMSPEDIEARLLSMVGDEITDPGYVSTTFDPSFAGTLAGAAGEGLDGESPIPALVLKVHVPEGGKGLYVKGLGEYDFEEEVLLPRSTPMTIAGVSVVNNPPRLNADGELQEMAPTFVVEMDAGDPAENLAIPTKANPIPEVPGVKSLPDYLRQTRTGPREGSRSELFKWGHTPDSIEGQYSHNPGGINSKLRAGEELEGATAELAEGLDAAIANARTERAHTVYRGTTAEAFLGDMSEEETEKALALLVGQEISDPGYLSTSSDRFTASLFVEAHEGKKRVPGATGVMMRIEVPEGGHGGAAIQTIFQEDEIVYARNTKLRVKDVKKLPGLSDEGKPVYVLDMEMVPPDDAPRLQRVDTFSGHNKDLPFDGLARYLDGDPLEEDVQDTIDIISADGPLEVNVPLFSGHRSEEFFGEDLHDSTVEENLRRLIGNPLTGGTPLVPSVRAGEALERAEVPVGTPYRREDYNSRIVFDVNAPAGMEGLSMVDGEVVIPDGYEVVVDGVMKSQPPQRRNGKRMKSTTFVVSGDLVRSDGPELSRTAEEVASDIEAVLSSIGDTLTDRIEQSILGE